MRASSPGSTSGTSTTRPSILARPSPPYTHFSMRTSFTMKVPLPSHESTSLLRDTTHRQPAHRKLSWRTEKLGQDSVRLRQHLLHRGPARGHDVSESGGASQ